MEDIFYSNRNDMAQWKSTWMKLCGLYYTVRCFFGPQNLVVFKVFFVLLFAVSFCWLYLLLLIRLDFWEAKSLSGKLPAEKLQRS